MGRRSRIIVPVGRKANEVSLSDHSLANVELKKLLEAPDFYQMVVSCSCGEHHYALLLADEVEIGVKIMMELRELRKRADDAIQEEVFGPPEVVGEIHMDP